MASFLSGLVKKISISSPSSSLVSGYHQQEDEQSISHSFYKIIPARSNSQKNAICVSIFTASEEPKRMGNFLKAIQSLKHPVILKIYDSNSKQNVISIVTERVSPLEYALETLSDSDLIVGFWRLLRCLEFLHENAKFLHGSIGRSSIFISEAHEMKLGGFEYCINYNSSLQTYLDEISCHEPLIHDEICHFGRNCPSFSCIDAHLLAVLFRQILQHHHFQKVELKNEFENALKKLDFECKKSFSFSSYLSWYLMNCKRHSQVISIVSFFEEYFVKSSEEKDAFLTEFIDCKMNIISSAYLQNRILPDLATCIEGCISRMEFVSSEIFLFCKISSTLEEKQFERQALPTVKLLFSVSDRGIRMILCKFMKNFAELVPKSLLNDSFYPLLVSGLADSHQIVRKESFLAILEIVPKLKGKILNGEFTKLLSRLQNDSSSEVRQTVVSSFQNLLSCFESENARTLLISGYSRALQDSNKECKFAALCGILATKSIYSAEDFATSFIPLISPLLVIATDRKLREKAHYVFDELVVQIKIHAKSIQCVDQTSLENSNSSISTPPAPSSFSNSSKITSMYSHKQKIKAKENFAKSEGWDF